MITAVRTPDATRCPQCSATLTGSGGCDACGLRLTGPEAARLWEVDSELLRLDAARTPLLAERSSLLVALRGEAPRTQDVVLPPPRPAGPEWTPQRTSNALLVLGGLLLAVAGVVFTAVTYERLGAGGRAAILLALTAAAGLAVPRARLRGLTSTAETLTAVTLVLAALDAYGLRKLGFAGDSDPLVYAAGSAAALAVLSAGYAVLVPVRLARAAAVVLAQLPVPLLLLDAEPSSATAALWLAALAAADLALVAVLSSRDWARPDVVGVAAGSGALVTLVATVTAAMTALHLQPGAGAAALVVCAAVIAGGAALVRDPGLRVLLSAVPVGVLALAAFAPARAELTDVQLPLVPAAVALVAVQAAALLPRALRTGPVLGALAVAAVAVVSIAEQVLLLALGPISWLDSAWSLPQGSHAKQALATGVAWDGTLVTPAVLLAGALTTVGAGFALHRLREAVPVAAALAAAGALVLPVALDLPYGLAVALLLLLGAAGALVPRPPALDLPLSILGGTVLVHVSVWSLADRATTLVVLPLAAAALAALSLRASQSYVATGAAGLAGLLAAGELAAIGAAADLAADQVGALLLLAVAALAAVADPRLGIARRTGVEAAAGVTAVATLVLTSTDPGWLSWTLAGLAVVALAIALRPDRRVVAYAGGLLLAASSWVRLADAGVTDPEPYVLPLALVSLVLGHLRRRSAPTTRSYAAYGPGLTALLGPSLLASYAGSPLWRPLTLAGVALVVVLLGARERLQAPLVIGGGVLAADAVLLLAPYADALPRWLVLGAAGALLVTVGATYEQRLRDLSRLREQYDALG